MPGHPAAKAPAKHFAPQHARRCGRCYGRVLDRSKHARGDDTMARASGGAAAIAGLLMIAAMGGAAAAGGGSTSAARTGTGAGAGDAAGERAVASVDPFIGTGGEGHTFP